MTTGDYLVDLDVRDTAGEYMPETVAVQAVDRTAAADTAVMLYMDTFVSGVADVHVQSVEALDDSPDGIHVLWDYDWRERRVMPQPGIE